MVKLEEKDKLIEKLNEDVYKYLDDTLNIDCIKGGYSNIIDNGTFGYYYINVIHNNKMLSMKAENNIFIALNNIKQINKYYSKNNYWSKLPNIEKIQYIPKYTYGMTYEQVIDNAIRKNVVEVSSPKELANYCTSDKVRLINRYPISVINIELSDFLCEYEIDKLDILALLKEYISFIKNDVATLICMNQGDTEKLEMVVRNKKRFYRVKDGLNVTDIINEYNEALTVFKELSM